MYKMFYDVKDIDIIFGLEFMDDIVRKMFLFLWKSFVIDQLILKFMFYILIQVRNVMKEFKKFKSWEKKLQVKMNRIRKKNMLKRLIKINENEEKELFLIVDLIRRLMVFVVNEDNQELLLLQINESDFVDDQMKNDEKEFCFGVQKMFFRCWKVFKISREFFLFIINKCCNILVKIFCCIMDDDKNNLKQE